MNRLGVALTGLLAVALMLVPGVASAAGQAPLARGESYRGPAGQTLTAAAPGVLANDRDPEGDPLTAELMGDPSYGTLDLKPDGSFTYTPNYTGGGVDSFSYWAFDGKTVSNYVHVYITMDATPVAAADSWGVLRPGPLTVAAPGVLANDSDSGGDALTAKLMRGPEQGSVNLAADGGFTYTPNPGFRGRATFTYRASDGRLISNVARVVVRVLAKNATPVAVADEFEVYENSPLSGSVLGNDTDADGDRLRAEIINEPAPYDWFVFNSDGTFEYLMPPHWDSDVSFSYRVFDGIAWSAPAEAYIDIIAVNSPPYGEPDYYEMERSQHRLSVPAPGVLANDYDDVEFDAVHVARVVQQPAHGDLTMRRSGAFLYIADPGFRGTDSFTYIPADSGEGSATGVSITVY